MSVSPTILLIALTVGVPLMLLALGVLYYAYLFGRQPVDALDQHVDALATESAEELLFALQEAVDRMQEQLATVEEVDRRLDRLGLDATFVPELVDSRLEIHGHSASSRISTARAHSSSVGTSA